MKRNEKKLWTLAKTARYLSVSRDTLKQLAITNQIKCLRVGRLLRFDPETLAVGAGLDNCGGK